MNHSFNRRDFLRRSGLAASGMLVASQAAAGKTKSPRKLFSAMGIAAPLERAADLKAGGAEFLTVGTSDMFTPDQPDSVFDAKLALIKASPLPVLACNGFLRPGLVCVGATANHDLVIDWAAVVFRRLKQAGGKFVVFGSGRSRMLPDGWPKDKADAQFIDLLKRMGPLAEQHGVTVVVEQLRAAECNYITRIGEAAALIRTANHPHVRVLADLYHMAQMGDTPADLKAAMDVVAHIEIAEKQERTYPGVAGDDFRPYFRILREADYSGAISVEGKGEADQVAAAFKEIARQAAEA